MKEEEGNSIVSENSVVQSFYIIFKSDSKFLKHFIMNTDCPNSN